jgi:arsenite-transporting ATPase
VHLTTSEPAAHLSKTLNSTLDNLTVSRIDPHIEIERYRQHVMDMAPTGHTLLIIDLTSAYHREVTRQMFKAHLHFITPMMKLQDTKQTKIIIVTLAEKKTPALEAANLQVDLRRAGIEPWAWVINNSLATTSTTTSLFHQRALNKLREIDTLSEQHSKRYAIVPMQINEPIGIQRLLDLSEK